MTEERVNGQADDAPLGGAVLFDVCKDLLEEEATRKASIEARGAAVITTSGAIVTLVFALAAVVTKPATYALPSIGLIPLLVALALFCAAIVVAVATFSPSSEYLGLTILPPAADEPQGSVRPNAAELVKRTQDYLRSNWDAPEGAVKLGLSVAAVERLSAARHANDGKAGTLALALYLQVAALAALAVSIGLILVTQLTALS